MSTIQEYKRARYLAFKAEGICVACRTAPSSAGVHCPPCRERNRIRNRGDSTPRRFQAEDWSKMDFADGPDAVAKRLGMDAQGVSRKMKSLGWKRIYISPTQKVVEKEESE